MLFSSVYWCHFVVCRLGSMDVGWNNLLFSQMFHFIELCFQRNVFAELLSLLDKKRRSYWNRSYLYDKICIRLELRKKVSACCACVCASIEFSQDKFFFLFIDSELILLFLGWFFIKKKWRIEEIWSAIHLQLETEREWFFASPEKKIRKITFSSVLIKLNQKRLRSTNVYIC